MTKTMTITMTITMTMFTTNSCRDRYEGQLNEFLLENKNLKEQLTTLKVVSSDVEICFIENQILGCGGPVGNKI